MNGAREGPARIAQLHSISKQLLEELKHAQRGYTAEEIGHVNRELALLIEALDRGAEPAADRAWSRLTGSQGPTVFGRILGKRVASDYVEHLRELRAALDEHDRGTIWEVRDELWSIERFTSALHDELDSQIKRERHPGYWEAPFRPPKHGGE